MAADREREEVYAHSTQTLIREANADDERFGIPQRKTVAPAVSVYDELDRMSAALAADATDFIFVLFWILTAAGFSEKSRSWIIAVAVYADRLDQHEDGAEIKDEELANFLGCSTRTIQRRRQDFIKESHRKLPIVRITEGDYVRSEERNMPTRYRFACVDAVADAVLAARKLALYQTDYRAALKREAFAAYDARCKVTQGNFPAATKRRRKRASSLDSKRAAIVKTIKTKVEKLRAVELAMIEDETSRLEVEEAEQFVIDTEAAFAADFVELEAENRARYFSGNSVKPRQTSDEPQLNSMGRQVDDPSKVVAPSVLVITLKEEGATTKTHASYISSDDLRINSQHDLSRVMSIPAIARHFRETESIALTG